MSPPNGTYLQNAYTIINQTPVIREKPYLVYSNSSGYAVMVPSLRTNSVGPTWSASSAGNATSIPISKFYIAQSSNDNSTTLNLALQRGINLIMTPGVYNLSAPLVIRNANTVVLGLGLPSLVPMGAFPSVIVADVGRCQSRRLPLRLWPCQLAQLAAVGNSRKCI